MTLQATHEEIRIGIVWKVLVYGASDEPEVEVLVPSRPLPNVSPYLHQLQVLRTGAAPTPAP